MNVSLSRARLSLVIVGNARKLYFNQLWRKLVRHAMEEGFCYDISDLVHDPNFVNKLQEPYRRITNYEQLF